MPGKERSSIFSSEQISTSSRDTDEVARSWPQLMALLLQVLQQVQKATGDGSVRLTRQQRAALIAEAGEAQKLYTYQVDTTKAWYQARTQDYQREAQAAAARAHAGATPEQQAHGRAYLKGLRASVEHTIHDTALTPEQRGQVVLALDSVDKDASKPLTRNIFEQIEGESGARARYAAAASEYRAAQHRQQITATAPQQGEGGDTAQWQRQNAQRFGELTTRITRLEAAIATLVPQQNATAATGSNGHPTPRMTQQTAQASSASEPLFTQEHAHSSNGAAAHAEADQPDTTHVEHEHPAPEADSAARQAGWEAQMQAEA